MEPQLYRPYPDYPLRGYRHRQPRRLLRQRRSHARHAAKPSAAIADAGRHGTAGFDGSRIPARRKSQSPEIHPSYSQGGGTRPCLPRPIRQRPRWRRTGRRLSSGRRHPGEQHHRNLCRDKAVHRQLALARRAFLPAYRQAHGQGAIEHFDLFSPSAVTVFPRHRSAVHEP